MLAFGVGKNIIDERIPGDGRRIVAIDQNSDIGVRVALADSFEHRCR
ncbi:MAG: hypothetical protein ACD_10C00802G0001 [uncultured bacterium]|nr:MAG: hypothetical protein ACD_10C00802G0001 [uncultured bacterium]